MDKSLRMTFDDELKQVMQRRNEYVQGGAPKLAPQSTLLVNTNKLSVPPPSPSKQSPDTLLSCAQKVGSMALDTKAEKLRKKTQVINSHSNLTKEEREEGWKETYQICNGFLKELGSKPCF